MGMGELVILSLDHPGKKYLGATPPYSAEVSGYYEGTVERSFLTEDFQWAEDAARHYNQDCILMLAEVCGTFYGSLRSRSGEVESLGPAHFTSRKPSSSAWTKLLPGLYLSFK